jgi:RimJ/RimL family protein N-acetyltransferase
VDDSVTLRPVDEDGVCVIERLLDDPASTGEFAWFGWRADPGRLRRRWSEDGMLGEDSGFFMITRGEDRLGLVNWRRKSGTPYGYRWEIGIALVPEARGKGYGTQAQRLLARYLFAHTPVHRIEAFTETGNVAEQRALERAGFTREGVMRGVGWRDGAWRDGAVYSIVRTDPTASA